MFSNRNKKVISNLTNRSFKANKLRNLTTIISIILTGFLFTSVVTIGIGTVESATMTMQMQKGSKSDADLRFLSEEQFESLKKSKMVDKAGCRRPIGFMTNTYHHNVEINYMDEIQRELNFVNADFGENPKMENEITLSDAALKDLKITPEIGVSIPVEFEVRGKQYHFDMVLSGWYSANNSQASTMLISDAFVQENKELFEDTYSDDREICGTYFSDIILNSKKNIEEQLDEFIYSVGGDPNDITSSNYILGTVNRVTNPNINWFLIIAVVLFGILFIICGYLLIYNVFDISVMQDIRYYGLLKTIGATQKQIRKLVYSLAVRLSIIGIPLGLIAGFLAGKLILPIVMRLFGSQYENLSINVSPNFIIFLLAALFTMFTIYISIRKTTRTAADVSPIEATKYNEGYSSKKTKVNRKNGAKIPNMARANLGRNRKRTMFIIVSLMLCIILLNSVIVVTNSIDEDKFIKKQSKTNAVLASATTFNNTRGYTSHEDGLNESAIEFIEQQPGVIEGGRLYKNTLDDLDISFDYNLDSDEVEFYDEENGRESAIIGGFNIPLSKDRRPTCNVYGASDEVISRMTIYEGESDIQVIKEKLATGDYIIEGVIANNKGEFDQYRKNKCSVGQQITAYVNGSPVKTYTVLSIALLNSVEYEVTNLTTGTSKVGGDAPFLYLSELAFKELYHTPTLLNYTFNMENGYEDDIENSLDEYTHSIDPSTGYSSIKLVKENIQSIQQMIYIVGGMIGVVFGLAGLINLINMIITSIITRRLEFASMQSIGMTDMQLSGMMIYESVFYVIGAGVIGLVVSFLVGITLISTICNSIWFFSFQFTIFPAAIVFFMLLIFAVIIPTISLKIFNKKSIVERLRESA